MQEGSQRGLLFSHFGLVSFIFLINHSTKLEQDYLSSCAGESFGPGTVVAPLTAVFLVVSREPL